MTGVRRRGGQGQGRAIHHLERAEIVRIDRFFLSPSPGRPSRFSSFPHFNSILYSLLFFTNTSKYSQQNPQKILARIVPPISIAATRICPIILHDPPTDSLTECVSLGFIHTLLFFISTSPVLHRALKLVFPLSPGCLLSAALT